MVRRSTLCAQPKSESTSKIVLAKVIDTNYTQHHEIAEICSRIMAVVVQRLEQSYMRISERDPSEPALRKIPALAKKARELGSLD